MTFVGVKQNSVLPTSNLFQLDLPLGESPSIGRAFGRNSTNTGLKKKNT